MGFEFRRDYARRLLLNVVNKKRLKMWCRGKSIAFSRKSLKLLSSRKTFPVISKNVSTEVREAVHDTNVEIEDPPKLKKSRVLKKFKDPFPKSLFLGRCDPEVLEYPEVLNNEEIQSVTALAAQVRNFFQNDVDSNEIDRTGQIPDGLCERLGKLKLYGLKLPWDYGGKDYTETESTVICEETGINLSLSKHITEQHRVCATLLNVYGSDAQKERYMRPIVKGELTASCAFLEDRIHERSEVPMEMLAVRDGDQIILDGEKKSVSLATKADIFIVFAKMAQKREDGSYHQTISAFIVDAHSPGITIHPPENVMAGKCVAMSKVSFKNVRAPADAMLGKSEDGMKMILTALGDKFLIAPQILGVTKKLISDVTRCCITNSSTSSPMIEMEYVKALIGRMVTKVYALESAIYLHAGITDLYEEPEAFMENAMLKVLASKTLQDVLRDAFQVLGSHAYKPELLYVERLLRESHYLSVHDEIDFLLKMTICLAGLQYVGKTSQEEVKKFRNPLMNPWFILRKKAQRHDRMVRAPKLHLKLEGYLHPTLSPTALVLEYCMERMKESTETLLVRYGQEIFDKHMELATLADMSIMIYSLIATLGRASRSYCIGLSEAEVEMNLAKAYTTICRREVTDHHFDIEEGPVENNTNIFVRAADRILANKGYCLESPITRNF